VSVRDVLAFRELQQQVAALGALTAQLLEESAEQAGRLAALETSASARCTACAARRAHDAARQRRLRHRHATEALEPV
jgi:hypothetical protein